MSLRVRTGNKVLIRKGTRSLDSCFGTGEKISFVGDRTGHIIDIYTIENSDSIELYKVAVVNINGYDKPLNYRTDDLEVREVDGIKIMHEKNLSMLKQYK